MTAYEKSGKDEVLYEIQGAIQHEILALSGNKVTDLEAAVFLKSSVIDSVNMANLVISLEDRYGIEIDAFFTDRNSVSSIGALARYIADLIET